MESLIVENPADVEDHKDNAPVSFLSLPPEIRNRIYRYSLVKRPSANPIIGLVQPALTRTNRQIRSEALPIYYGNNRFLIDILTTSSMDDINRWANVIRMFREFKAGRTGGRGTGSLQSIRHLTCRMRGSSTATFLILEVALIDPAQRRSRKRRGCRGWDSHFVYKPKDVRGLQDWDGAYKLVETFLREELGAGMHEPGVCRLISTIAMVANECPAVTKEVHFHYDYGWDELSPFEDPFASDINDS